jgi:hypothetical protein
MAALPLRSPSFRGSSISGTEAPLVSPRRDLLPGLRCISPEGLKKIPLGATTRGSGSYKEHETEPRLSQRGSVVPPRTRANGSDWNPDRRKGNPKDNAPFRRTSGRTPRPAPIPPLHHTTPTILTLFTNPITSSPRYHHVPQKVLSTRSSGDGGWTRCSLPSGNS